MPPKNYRKFCMDNGIPLPSRLSFYLMLNEIGKKNTGSAEFISESYFRLVDRLELLDELIDKSWNTEINSLEKARRMLNSCSNYLWHVGHLSELGLDVSDPERVEKVRDYANTMARFIEHPDNNSLIQALSGDKLSKRTRELLFMKKGKSMEKVYGKLISIENWNDSSGAHRMADVALEDRPYSYP